ncbi:MAG: hypothetical protein QW041_01650 [Candidatus Pacearchaeota archaeon]
MQKRILIGGRDIPKIEGLDAPMYSGYIDFLDSNKEHDRLIKLRLENIGLYCNAYYIDAKIGDEDKLKESISKVEKKGIKYIVYQT